MKVGFHLDRWLQANKFTPPYESETQVFAVSQRRGKKMVLKLGNLEAQCMIQK